MSYRWPKRVQDMTPLQHANSTEDAAKSPEKPANKNMVRRLLPKRVSEMTPLKSDSEDDEDEDEKINNLNCARRLTNSDYLDSDSDSPKKLPNSPPSKAPAKPQQNENNPNKLNSSSGSRSSSSVTSSSASSSTSASVSVVVPTAELRKCAPFAKVTPPSDAVPQSSSVVSTALPPSGRLLQRPRDIDTGGPVYRQMMPSFGLLRSSQRTSAAAFSDVEEPKTSISIFKNIKSTATVADDPPLRLPKITADDGQHRSAISDPPIGRSGTKKISCSSLARSLPNASVVAASTCETTATTTTTSSIDMPSTMTTSTVATAATNHFKTPSATAVEYTAQRTHHSRFPPLSRGPHNATKSKSELRSEFQSKKVLFHTPSTLLPTTPLIAAIGDHSIDLSLNDSVPAPEANEAPSSVVVKTTTADGPPAGSHVLHINGKEFVVQRKIGSGGSSVVYLAQQWDTKADVAVKVVDLQGDAAVVTGYVNETKLLAKLQGDSSVIELFEYVHIPAESTLYVVMERGDHDLNQVLRAYTGRLPLYVLMRLWHQMLLAVAYIHRNGVIHSDLKPANFLLVAGRLKLIDFGIASNIAVDSTSIIKFSQAGTFNYVSPEALIDTSTGDSPTTTRYQPKIKISTKSDVWSLGCILYLLLYRKTPFAHINNIHTKVMTIVNERTQIEYAPLPNYVPGMFLEMLQRCLVHAPKQRASVAELLQSPYDALVPHDALGLISEPPPPTSSSSNVSAAAAVPSTLSSSGT